MKRKIAVVTGGGRGLGRSISLELAKNGYQIVIVVRSNYQAAEETKALIESVGGEAAVVCCDITDRAQIVQLVEEVKRDYQKIDLLVNNAGLSCEGPLESIDAHEWEKVVAINYSSVFLVSTALLEMLKEAEDACILNVAAASAVRAFAYSGPYGSCKAAVVNLTAQMAVEWARYGIRVNCICPGPIATEESLELIECEPQYKEAVNTIPLKRMAEPEEIAKAAAFLASDSAKYITGESLLVDGGSIHTWYLNNV